MPEARSILQGRQLGVASLRLLPKRVGMRPIVNLGRASYMSFPAPRAPGSAQRRQRTRRIHLSFRPVNFHLQSLHKVRAPPLCGIGCQLLKAGACPVHIFNGRGMWVRRANLTIRAGVFSSGIKICVRLIFWKQDTTDPQRRFIACRKVQPYSNDTGRREVEEGACAAGAEI